MSGAHGIEQLQKSLDPGADPAARARIAAWFASRWPQASEVAVRDIVVPRDGISNAMLIVTLTWCEHGAAREGRYVLRLEPSDEPIAPRIQTKHATAVAFEHAIQQAVAQHSRCPVAPAVGVELSDAVIGRPFYAMQYIAGRVPPSQAPMVDSFLVHDCTPETRRRLVESGLDALMALQQLDYRKAGLAWLDPSAPGAYTLAPHLAAYRALSEKYLRGRAHPVLTEAIGWLAAHEPQDLQPALAWGDSRPGNILFTPDGSAAAALDWEMAAILPRDADIGLWLLADFMVHESEGAARLPGYPTRDEQLAYYEARSGRSVRDLAYWELFTAMKIAYVFVRVVRRMQDLGVLPADNDVLMFENFAVRYLQQHLGCTHSPLVSVTR